MVEYGGNTDEICLLASRFACAFTILLNPMFPSSYHSRHTPKLSMDESSRRTRPTSWQMSRAVCQPKVSPARRAVPHLVKPEEHTYFPRYCCVSQRKILGVCSEECETIHFCSTISGQRAEIISKNLWHGETHRCRKWCKY